MSDSNAWRVRYAGVELALEAPDWVAHPVKRDTEPFFVLDQDASARAPFASISLIASPLPPEVENQLKRDGLSIAVDTSLYAQLASSGRRWNIKGGHVVRIDATGSFAVVIPGERRILLYQPDPGRLTLDAQRLIKGLLTVAIEEQGGVQLHASGVVIDGKAVLLVGDMWQGKTTLLLELLRHFRTAQLSCDTTVLIEDRETGKGKPRACGWPSPFSVSHGTMADHPQLYPYFPPDRRNVPYATLWAEGRKTVLTSRQICEAFHADIVPVAREVALCLVIRFRPDEPTVIRPVPDAPRLEAMLRSCYLGSRDPIYHQWHGYRPVAEHDIDINIRRMSETLMKTCDVCDLTWAPGPVSLMKRLPLLAQAHADLSRLAHAFTG